MKWLWFALTVGTGGYGLHAFATQLSLQSAAVPARPITAAEFALQNRTDRYALSRFLHSQER